MSQRSSYQASGGHAHPIDLLIEEIARWRASQSGGASDGADTLDLAAAVEEAGGQDVVNLAAAFASILIERGTVLGAVPPKRMEDVWTLLVCHRIAQSYHHAFTSYDPSGEVWHRHVAAWERAHLAPQGYFKDHPRAFG
jgi:hypothetical protein